MTAIDQMDQSNGPRPRADTSRDATARSLPRDGDVVVTREPQPVVRYTLREFPGVAQLQTADRDEAVRLARRFAQRAAADLWYLEDGVCRMLESYRRLV